MSLSDSLGPTAFAAAAALCLLLPALSQGRDERSTPPELRQFRSPFGNFRLDIRSRDGWKSNYAEAELFRIHGASATSVWRMTLKHRLGPARVLVNDAGQVVLLDEWFRSAADLAVQVLDEKGGLRRSYGFHDVAKVAQTGPDRLVTSATVGSWMSAEPALDSGAATATLMAAGRSLRLTFASGTLEPR